MSGHAGGHSLGGRAERSGTKGYAPDDTPLRDGHNEEPDTQDDATPPGQRTTDETTPVRSPAGTQPPPSSEPAS